METEKRELPPRRRHIIYSAKGVYDFALRRDVSPENIIEYIKRLGHQFEYYTNSEAEKLNDMCKCKEKSGIDFLEICGATSTTPEISHTYKKILAVRIHREKNRSKKNLLKTLVHELGHVVLDHLEYINEENREECENEAELFSYALFHYAEKGGAKAKEIQKAVK